MKLLLTLMIFMICISNVYALENITIGIDYKPTIYEQGDKFINSDYGHIWELIEWVYVFTDSFNIDVYRWKIKIHNPRIDIEINAWTDDCWLDKMKKIN